MIPDETIERVRESADIVQIIGEHVNLKRSGADYRGPCPFHQGKNRNFSVSPRRGMYHCFVCHESGDVFRFFQKHLGLDWPSAIRLVAERVGVPILETRGRQGPDEREPLWEVNAAAAEFFRARLRDQQEGRAAREYLASRALDEPLVERHGLGWAPRDPRAMRDHLAQLGYDDTRQLEGGLLAQRDDGELRTRFRGRLMIPILDGAGRHVGFGGRVIGDGEPKYLNSPETRVFSKGALLFNYHAARHAIRKEDRVLVVEGFFDAIRIAESGVDWVVAPLGTALAEGQAALLRRTTKNAYLLYDADAAGLRATFRAGDELLKHGMSVQIVTLPAGEDPDSYVRANGGEPLLEHIAHAIDVFERKIQLLERGGWFSDLRRKRRALDRLIPTIRATADPLTRDLYLTRAAEVGGVSKELLGAEADRPERPSRANQPASRTDAPRAAGRRVPPPAARITRGISAEAALVRVMLRDRSQVTFLLERLGTEDFQDPEYKAIFAALVEHGADTPIESLALVVPAAAVERLEKLLADDSPLASVDDALRTIECRGILQRNAEIDELRRLKRGDGDALFAEKGRLARRAQELKCPQQFWK
ncbi:MAG TPA: DNA primase [Gemmatimonadaceae bacterium]|nr:DNA primase [Gemmatimonadaceae bacterium]